MRKKIVFLLMVAVSAGLVAQEQAVLKDFSGKVEVQLPGGGWKPAAANQKLPRSAVISTGFNSHATVELISSTVRVKPLTRMSITELAREGNKAVATLDLRVGRLNARVDKAEGLEHDFKLRSPVSTAAVRGTEFNFARGRTEQIDGSSRVGNRLGQGRTLDPGETSRTAGSDRPSGGEEGFRKEASTDIVTAPGAAPPPARKTSTGSIRVVVGGETQP
ncbi:MAG: FecR protein [Synergistetes bacterium ADurb.Bin520]|nr:MAG: FecR protein [Synergistetes bacterium ADurb.Bin520]